MVNVSLQVLAYLTLY